MKNYSTTLKSLLSCLLSTLLIVTPPALQAQTSESGSLDDMVFDNIQGAAWDTSDERYLVHLDKVPAELKSGESHSWCLRVTDMEGTAAPAKTRLVFVGGMPQHGHGLPNTPATVRKAQKNCPYRVDGIEFHMPGVWQIGFVITSPKGSKHEVRRLVNVK